MDLHPFAEKTANHIHHQQFLTPGIVGNIECLLSTPTLNKSDIQNIAVICHPHPLHGGTMNNKVVYTLAKTLNKQNIPVLRFNFRGVERSEGDYDEGNGEKEDLQLVANLLKILHPKTSLWLGGFSFGAYIATSMQHKLEAKHLITIAPAVTSFDFLAIPEPNCSWLLVQGLADEIVDAQAVLQWAKNLSTPPVIQTLEDTSHFFHRRLVDLAKIIENDAVQNYNG